MNTISQLQVTPQAPPGGLPPLPTGDPDGASFKDFLIDSIQQVNNVQMEADRAVESLFTGGDVNPAEVLTAVQKADLAFRLTMQLRNKVMEVYREIQDIRI